MPSFFLTDLLQRMAGTPMDVGRLLKGCLHEVTHTFSPAHCSDGARLLS
jgi:predicted Zn-dependent protease